MRKTRLSLFRAYHSLDASLALLLAIFSLAAFLAVFSSASESARSSADGASSSLAALRLSSLALFEVEQKGDGLQAVPYYESNVIDPQRLSSLDAGTFAKIAGRGFASVEVESSDGEIIGQSAGNKSGAVYCATRLALYRGKPAAFRVCIS